MRQHMDDAYKPRRHGKRRKQEPLQEPSPPPPRNDEPMAYPAHPPPAPNPLDLD